MDKVRDRFLLEIFRVIQFNYWITIKSAIKNSDVRSEDCFWIEQLVFKVIIAILYSWNSAVQVSNAA